MGKCVKFVHRGDFNNTTKFFQALTGRRYERVLHEYGERGVRALAAATPVDSGETASRWSYEIVESGGGFSINWTNSNINDGVNIALILQYGHGTGTGGYVKGRDYINPAIQPIFDEMADKVWKEVTDS